VVADEIVRTANSRIQEFKEVEEDGSFTASFFFCLAGEICGSPIRFNGGRKFGSRSPRTDAGQRGFNSLLFAASCLSNLFTLCG
jgi:hypothetical protein